MAGPLRRVRRRMRRVGNLQRRAEAGNQQAEGRLGGATERLGRATQALQQRTQRRQFAGRPTGRAQRVLGRAAGVVPQAEGAPNFALPGRGVPGLPSTFGTQRPVAGMGAGPAETAQAGFGNQAVPAGRAFATPADSGLPDFRRALQGLTSPAGPPGMPALSNALAARGGARPVAATVGGGGAPPAAAPPAGGGTTFSDALAGAFGQGNPFGVGTADLGATAGRLGGEGSAFQPLGLFGNPLETAEARAQHLLQQNLARIGAGFAGSGLGSSSRHALQRGSAIGEAATGLGDILAARGLQTRGEDLNRLLSAAMGQEGLGQQERSRALQAFLGAGQLEQGQQGLNQQATAQALGVLNNLIGAGGGLTALGSQEQLPPGLQAILAALGNFGQTRGQTLSGGETTTLLGP